MTNLLLIDTSSYDKAKKSGRFYYIIRYCIKTYCTTLLHYVEKDRKEINSQSKSLKTMKVRMLLTEHSSKSSIMAGLLYQIFFTFIQPPYAALIASRRLDKNDICITEGIWAGLIGIALKKLRKINVLVYEDLDIFPFFWKNKIFQIILSVIEKYVVNHADIVVSVNASLAELRRAQGAKNVIIIPNGVDYNFFMRGQNKKDHIPTLIYVGWLQEYQGIDFSIKCLPDIIRSVGNVRYLILGEGPFENQLKELILKLKLENNVFLLGQKPHESIPDYFSESDIAVATRKPDILTKYASPYKIPEYLAAGLPVIITKVGLDDDALMGTIPVAFDRAEFTDAIIGLLSDDKKYEQVQKNALRTAESLDWNKLLEQEFAEIEQVRLQ